MAAGVKRGRSALDDADRLSGEKGGDVLDHLPVSGAIAIGRDIAEVRRDLGPRQGAEGMVERQRLGIEDVEPGARDPLLAQTLHKLRSAGKKLFLLTNSRWPYTEKMMTYLLGGAMSEYPTWRNFFDVVIVAATKPAFFQERRPMMERVVAPGSGDEGLKKGGELAMHFSYWAATGTMVGTWRVGDRQPQRVRFPVNFIPGLDEGLDGITAHTRRRFIIPPELAWGAQGNGWQVPPNTSVIFDVECLWVQAPLAPPTPTPAGAGEQGPPAPTPTPARVPRPSGGGH